MGDLRTPRRMGRFGASSIPGVFAISPVSSDSRKAFVFLLQRFEFGSGKSRLSDDALERAKCAAHDVEAQAQSYRRRCGSALGHDCHAVVLSGSHAFREFRRLLRPKEDGAYATFTSTCVTNTSCLKRRFSSRGRCIGPSAPTATRHPEPLLDSRYAG